MVSVFIWVPLLCLCGVDVVAQWVENNGLWYYISQDDKRLGYHDARMFCESMNAHLAVIANTKQNTFLRNQFSDKKARWIGMSNMRTNHDAELCQCDDLFWENDKTCDNSFRSFIYKYVPPKSENCLGMALETWMWITKPCTEKHGFICQWQCEEFYLQLKDRPFYSGIYRLDHYFNEHVVYKKLNSTPVILKSIPKEQWVVIENLEHMVTEDITDVDFHYEAYYQTDSYVPYGSSSYWKNMHNKKIQSDFICTSCKQLSTCLKRTYYTKSCNDNLLLKTNGDSPPEFKNNNASVTIKSNGNSEMCYVNTDINYQNCKYSAPSPLNKTKVTLSNGETLTITKMCRRRSPRPSLASDEDLDKQIILIVTSIVVGIVFVVIVVLISIYVVRNRKQNTIDCTYYNNTDIKPATNTANSEEINIVHLNYDGKEVQNLNRQSTKAYYNKRNLEHGASVDSDELYEQIDVSPSHHSVQNNSTMQNTCGMQEKVHSGYMSLGTSNKTTPGVYECTSKPKPFQY